MYRNTATADHERIIDIVQEGSSGMSRDELRSKSLAQILENGSGEKSALGIANTFREDVLNLAANHKLVFIKMFKRMNLDPTKMMKIVEDYKKDSLKYTNTSVMSNFETDVRTLKMIMERLSFNMKLFNWSTVAIILESDIEDIRIIVGMKVVPTTPSALYYKSHFAACDSLSECKAIAKQRLTAVYKGFRFAKNNGYKFVDVAVGNYDPPVKGKQRIVKPIDGSSILHAKLQIDELSLAAAHLFSATQLLQCKAYRRDRLSHEKFAEWVINYCVSATDIYHACKGTVYKLPAIASVNMKSEFMQTFFNISAILRLNLRNAKAFIFGLSQKTEIVNSEIAKVTFDVVGIHGFMEDMERTN